jgi:hypothetical protein
VIDMPVYGDCLSTNGFEPVSISRISEEACRVTFPSGDVPPDLVLTIWIGAIGPLTGRARALPGPAVTLEFDEVLDERVIRHFACV